MHHERERAHSAPPRALPDWMQGVSRDYKAAFVLLLVTGIFFVAVLVKIEPLSYVVSAQFGSSPLISTSTDVFQNWTKGRFYPIQPTGICPKNGKHPFLVIFVPSRPANAMDRSALRDTWGMHARLCDVAVVFGFGRFESTETQHEAYVENSVYGDLLQVGDVVDHYHNQTQLILAFLQWGALHCPGSQFIGKADEDTWINVHDVVKYLRMPEAPYSAIGHFTYGQHALRKPEQKWFVTMEEYPNQVYPPFAFGQLYIFPLAIVPRLLSTAYSGAVRIHWLDDVYIGGQLPEYLQLPLLHVKMRAQLYEADAFNCTNSPQPPTHAQRFNCKCVGRDWTILHATPAVAKRNIFHDPCMSMYRQYACRLD